MSYEVISVLSGNQAERFAILDTETDRLVQGPEGRTRKFSTLAAAIGALVRLKPGHRVQSARARAGERKGPQSKRRCVVCKQAGHDRRNCPERTTGGAS